MRIYRRCTLLAYALDRRVDQRSTASGSKTEEDALLHNHDFETLSPLETSAGSTRQNPRRTPRAFLLGLLLALGIWTAGAILLIG